MRSDELFDKYLYVDKMTPQKIDISIPMQKAFAHSYPFYCYKVFSKLSLKNDG